MQVAVAGWVGTSDEKTSVVQEGGEVLPLCARSGAECAAPSSPLFQGDIP